MLGTQLVKAGQMQYYVDGSGAGVHPATLKWLRAGQHFSALQQAVEAFEAANPEPFVVDVDEEQHRRLYRRGAVRPLPGEVNLIFGDLVQNLRAALDHMVYAISLHATADPKGCEFPIYEHPAAGQDHAGFDPDGRRKIRYLPSEVQGLIEQMQPYHPLLPSLTRPFIRHPLWDLHQLANIDKHREIPLLVTVTEAQVVEVHSATPVTENPVPQVEWSGSAMEEGDPIVAVPLPRGGLSFKPSIVVEVVIDTPGVGQQPVLTLGRRLVEHVSWIVGLLRVYL